MKEILDNLSTCLYSGEICNSNIHSPKFTFTEWLLSSNCPKIGPFLKEERFKSILCPKIGPYLKEERFKNMLEYIVYESLQEIFDVLMKSPQADYFWYTYPENGGELTWVEPHHDVVPSNSLRVDKEKIKVFLRDIKIETLLQ